MCGICGVVGRIEEHELDVMTDSMAHRGPDGRGAVRFDGPTPAGLGHRRLAIIDPSPAGAQPMSHAHRWWITYNGELYNFRELRAELEARGERFRTECDTEVLLRLFAVEGEAMMSRLRGIFAFAIWDEHEQRLFVARDRMGVKPLYYTTQPGLFAFASELRALLPLLGSVRMDERRLADFLSFLWVPDPDTAFDGIYKLPAGHCAWVDASGPEVRRYWDVSFAPESRSDDAWAAAVRDAVTDAVDGQLVADVPLGSFLSGGVDSSAIVAAMARGGGAPRTYAIGFKPEDLKHEIVPDDMRYARQVADQLGTRHEEIMLKPDILDLLPRTIWHLEEPVADPAAISTYLICREAGRTMPVMLSGVGGDELFAGYPRHLAYRISRVMDALPDRGRELLERLAEPIARPGSPGRLRGPRRNLWKYMRAAGMDPLDRYLSFLTYYPRADLDRVMSADAAERAREYDPLARHRRHLAAASDFDELATLLYLDAKTFLPSLNLTYTDKMSMAASVEVRVPLLDDRLVELAGRIPSRHKLRGWRRKYVFKRSQEGILPKEVIWRPKAGFGAPVRSWLVGDLREMVGDVLSDGAIAARGLLEPSEVRRLQRENLAGTGDYSLQIYAMLFLELWCRQWIDTPWSFDRLASLSASETQLVR